MDTCINCGGIKRPGYGKYCSRYACSVIARGRERRARDRAAKGNPWHCVNCGYEKAIRQGDYCSDIECVRVMRLEYQKGYEGWYRHIPLDVRQDLLADPCVYCGGKAEEIDHIVPRSRGGTDETSNLAPACKRCNRSKRALTVEEWQRTFRWWRISQSA